MARGLSEYLMSLEILQRANIHYSDPLKSDPLKSRQAPRWSGRMIGLWSGENTSVG